jgi:hypothetical protein
MHPGGSVPWQWVAFRSRNTTHIPDDNVNMVRERWVSDEEDGDRFIDSACIDWMCNN